MTEIQTGYCTNVHAGADLAGTVGNLERHALAVRRQVRPDGVMGVGLWLSASAARQLVREGGAGEFARWLRTAGLLPFTFNGFPFGDFHRDVVKHDVYRPTWYDPARVDYTRDLIHIQHALLPAGVEGSISTLPIAWGHPQPSEGQLQTAAANLRRIATELAALERDTGRVISICLEPEPGCVLQVSDDVVRFFEDHLLPDHDERPIRRHVRVCHDVCHQVVMGEGQREVLEKYHAAGIGVGKVQVSSAVCLPLHSTPADRHAAALAQLGRFAEPRYLHQTTVRRSPGADPVFYEDLGPALADPENRTPAAEWRVHFHVPIYVARFDELQTSSAAIDECIRTASRLGLTTHFEVETYAWGVLPVSMHQPDLASGIAVEMTWFEQKWQECAAGR